MAAVEILRHVLRHNKTLNSSVMFPVYKVKMVRLCGTIMWGFHF